MSDIICYIFIVLIITNMLILLAYSIGVSNGKKQINEQIKRSSTCEWCVYHFNNTQRCRTCKMGAIDRYQTVSQYLSDIHRTIQE